MVFLCYPKCTTCGKAKKWLDENGIEYEFRDIKQQNPTYEELKAFTYVQEANSPCPYCANHCNRSILTFSTNESWVTNNRCERGEILGNPADQETRNRLKALAEKKKAEAKLEDLRQEYEKYEKMIERYREDIEKLLKMGFKFYQIADNIQKHPTTISKEILNNRTEHHPSNYNNKSNYCKYKNTCR